MGKEAATPRRGLGVKIEVTQFTGAPPVESLANLPAAIVECAQRLAADARVDVVEVFCGMRLLTRLTPTADETLARVVGAREAPRLADLIRSDPGIAKEMRAAIERLGIQLPSDQGGD